MISFSHSTILYYFIIIASYTQSPQFSCCLLTPQILTKEIVITLTPWLNENFIKMLNRTHKMKHKKPKTKKVTTKHYTKMKFYITDFLQHTWSISQFPADLVSFTKEILTRKLHFLCRETWPNHEGDFQ